MNPPLDPTETRNVTLEARQWDQILALLGECGPYRVVAPLIQLLHAQVARPANSSNVVPMGEASD